MDTVVGVLGWIVLGLIAMAALGTGLIFVYALWMAWEHRNRGSGL